MSTVAKLGVGLGKVSGVVFDVDCGVALALIYAAAGNRISTAGCLTINYDIIQMSELRRFPYDSKTDRNVFIGI